MAKSSGLGDRLIVAGIDVSGAVGAVSRIGMASDVIDVTPISAQARQRLYGIADGEIAFTAFWDSDPGGVFDALKAPTAPAERVVTYLRGQQLGGVAASLQARQVSFDWTREAGGGLTASVQCLAAERGLDWCVQLTPGIRTDAAASTGASVDGGAQTATGWVAYLQVLSLASGSPQVIIEESADNGGSDPWAALAGATFTGITAPSAQVLRSATLTAAVERYLRVRTTGTFSGLTFVVTFCRAPVDV